MSPGFPAYAFPPKAMFGLMLAYSLSLGGCGGGSSGATGLSLATTTVDIERPNASFLFSKFPVFDGQDPHAFTINVTTGEVTHFASDDQIIGFLNKQPDPLIAPIYPQSTKDTAKDTYVGLSHLSHQLHAIQPSQGPSDLFGIHLVNHADPGQFFLFGRAGPQPSVDMIYKMTTLYFCSFCTSTLGETDSQFAFTSNSGLGIFSASSPEFSLSIPVSVSDPLSLSDPAPSSQNRRDNHALSGTHLQIHETDEDVLSHYAHARFFGPEANNIGLLFAVTSQAGILSGAGVGAP